jgi:hypothetical protein
MSTRTIPDVMGEKLVGRVLEAGGLVGAFASFLAAQGATRWWLIVTFASLTIVAWIFDLSKRFAFATALGNLATCRALGIVRIHRLGRGAGTTPARLSQAAHIAIMAVSGQHFVKAHKEEIIEALVKQRATIRVLIGEPVSPFVRDVEVAESPSRIGQISSEIEQTERLLTEYLTDSSNRAGIRGVGQISLGYYSTHLRASMILCDKSWGWLTLNLPPKRALEMMSLELCPAESGLFEMASTHFDQTWKWAVANQRVKRIHVTPGEPPTIGNVEKTD